jgi:anaerobic selenocysteine-containing dehydrogenase
VRRASWKLDVGSFRHLLGLDTRADEYRYAIDPVAGYVSAQKAPDAWVATTCGYCSVGCGMFVGVKDGRAVAVRGNPDHPVNRGWLCPKGLSEHHTIDASNRARYPLLRRSRHRSDGANSERTGEFARVPWSEALRTMAARFREVQEQYGRQAVGVISTGQLVTEEFYTLGKLVQLGLGTSNYDGNTTLCMSTAVAGYKRSFGSDGPPGAYEDFDIADVVMLIGANIADNHPILCRRLQSNPHKTLIVVDPRVTKTAMLADLHLPIRPRADLALINALIHVVIEHDLIDRDYVDQHTTGFDRLRESVCEYTAERAAEITGLAPELIYRTAWLYANADRALIAWTMGVNHSTKGTETVNAINNLALITGNVGRAGAAPFSITGQCNAMGTREAGFASSMPGYRNFESASDRAELASLWNVGVERIPAARGLAYPDIIEAALDKRIRALWIIATNPIVSFPNLGALQQALEGLEFLVVQDGFHPTPTSEYADLVLPAAIWGEKDGTYTNSERRVSKANRAIDPPGEAKADFDIFLDLAGVIGIREELFPGWTRPQDAFNEWKRVSAGRLCDYSGMTYEALEEHGGIQWPFPAGATNPQESRRLYTDATFQTHDGRARLLPVHWEPFPEQPTTAFPLVLNTGRTVEHWHTRTKTANVPILERLSPEAWLEMNPRDARALRLKAQDRVDVVSQRGRIRNVELRLTETIAPGQVFVPFHYAEANANQVTQSAFDPISREPNYKQSAVRVERATGTAKSQLPGPKKTRKVLGGGG